MKLNKINRSVRDAREQENNTANIEKNKCLIEYVAMMAGVDLPSEEQEGEQNE